MKLGEALRDRSDAAHSSLRDRTAVSRQSGAGAGGSAANCPWALARCAPSRCGAGHARAEADRVAAKTGCARRAVPAGSTSAPSDLRRPVQHATRAGSIQLFAPVRRRMTGKRVWMVTALGFAVVLLASGSRSHAQIVLPGAATIGSPGGYHYGHRAPAGHRSAHHPADESNCDSACKNLSCGKGTSCECTHQDGKLQTSCRR
jgi:hypothetical protein